METPGATVRFCSRTPKKFLWTFGHPIHLSGKLHWFWTNFCILVQPSADPQIRRPHKWSCLSFTLGSCYFVRNSHTKKLLYYKLDHTNVLFIYTRINNNWNLCPSQGGDTVDIGWGLGRNWLGIGVAIVVIVYFVLFKEYIWGLIQLLDEQV